MSHHPPQLRSILPIITFPNRSSLPHLPLRARLPSFLTQGCRLTHLTQPFRISNFLSLKNLPPAHLLSRHPPPSTRMAHAPSPGSPGSAPRPPLCLRPLLQCPLPPTDPPPRLSLPLRSAGHLSGGLSRLGVFPTWRGAAPGANPPSPQSWFSPARSPRGKLSFSPPPLLPTRKWIRSHRPQRPRTKWRRGKKEEGGGEPRAAGRTHAPWEACSLPAHVGAERHHLEKVGSPQLEAWFASWECDRSRLRSFQ